MKNNYKSTLEIKDNMLNDEYEYILKSLLWKNVERYLYDSTEYYQDIFGKTYIFNLEHKRYLLGDKLFEEINLIPKVVNIEKYDYIKLPNNIVLKYTFKERIKILLKGKL